MTCTAKGGWLLVALLALQACGQAEPPAPVAMEAATETSTQPVETPVAEAGGMDPVSGLIIDEHWELVKAHCGACHSTRLVTQNRGDRETWLAMIRWMQDSQGLWPFDPATETGILDYLATNYAPLAVGRRPALDAALLPPNPWNE